VSAEHRTSLRQRARSLFALATVLVLVSIAISTGGLLSLLSARRQLVRRVDPALTSSERLLGALVDQETGVRGYVITSDPTFLEPYERGRRAEARAEAELAALVDDIPDVGDQADDVFAAVSRWQDDYAVPTIAAVEGGATGPRSEADLQAGRRDFETLRDAIGSLQRALGEERDQAVASLEGATTRLIVILAAAALGQLGTGVALWRLVRRQVQDPLDSLHTDAGKVAAGDLDHAIVPVGLSELYELGIAMELMRARIVSDLAETERARSELEHTAADLNRSNAELEQFAYVASHDLQEPLRKVASFCQLLQSRYGGQLDERADQYIEFAVDGAKRMQALINDLLTFSRVGRVTGEQAVIELDDAVALAQANLGLAIEEAGATVTSDPLPAVRGEGPLLVALFQNLIGNAVKFRRPDVAPEVHISVAPTDDGLHEITVRDNGIGIAPDYAERVFVIFQRLHPKERYEGTGIGLALCRKIVEHHGGTIRADTDAGGAPGTTIRLTLPALQGAHP
jgi:signal transduction histidine kinase